MLRVVHNVLDGFYFLLHQIAEHLVVLVEVVGNNGRRSVATVSRAKGIIDIVISIRSQLAGKFSLARLHFFLCSIVSWICLVNANGLTLLFRIETEVFKQERSARKECCHFLFSLATIGGKLHLNAQSLGNVLDDLFE